MATNTHVLDVMTLFDPENLYDSIQRPSFRQCDELYRECIEREEQIITETEARRQAHLNGSPTEEIKATYLLQLDVYADYLVDAVANAQRINEAEEFLDFLLNRTPDLSIIQQLGIGESAWQNRREVKHGIIRELQARLEEFKHHTARLGLVLAGVLLLLMMRGDSISLMKKTVLQPNQSILLHCPRNLLMKRCWEAALRLALSAPLI